MVFEFQTVEKKLNPIRTSPDLIRITKKWFRLGENVAAKFMPYKEPTMFGRGEKINLLVEVDTVNKAIRLTPNHDRGFSFGVRDDGAGNNMPASLQQTLTLGDYKPVEGQENVFQLVQ